MKKLILVLLSSSLALAEEPPVDDLFKQLRSPDFQKREEAMEKIWELGDQTLPYLSKLTGDQNPELAARAASVRRKIQSGLRPDTPKEISDQIEKYFSSERRGKLQVIRKLTELNAIPYLMRLLQIEDDADLKPFLRDTVARGLPRMLLSALEEERLDDVRELLHVGRDYRSYLRCGTFFLHQGELEAEIARLKELDDEASRQRYLAYLRVKGDVPLLVRESQRLGDRVSEATGELMLGNLAPTFQLVKASERVKGVDRFYLNWAIARNGGDEKEIESARASIIAEAKKDPQNTRSILNLMRIGEPKIVEEIIETSERWDLKFDYLLSQDRTLEIPKVLGVDLHEASDDWLKEKSDIITQSLDLAKTESTINLMAVTARFFGDRGLPVQEARVLEALFDALRKNPNKTTISWLQDYIYPTSLLSRGGAQAFAREVDDFDLPMDELLAHLPYSSEPTLWLKEELKQMAPDLKSEDFLKLVFSFLGSLCLDEKEYETWFQKVETRVRKEYQEDGDDHGLRHLVHLCVIAGRAEEALNLHLERGEPAAQKPREITQRARFAYYLENWKESSISYEANIGRGPETYSEQFPYSLVIEKLGEKEKSKALFQKALRFANCGWGGPDGAYYSAAYYQIDFRKYQEARASLKQSYLCSWDLVSQSSVAAGNLRVINLLAREAVRARDWKAALAFQEFFLWAVGELGQQGYLNARFKSEFARGMLRFEEGHREEAEKILTQAHALIPASGLLADDFFPVLREAGLTELHDTLCEKSLAHARKIIEVYPNDANVRNVFGWIASRASRNLPEAEEHMKVAVKIEPRSEAYLDTLAEVYFAMRNREEAIKWSEKSFANSAVDPQLREQYYRFRFEDFPVP